MWPVLFVMLSACPAAAWQSGLSGPVLGHILEPRTGKLRPVLGIPGSATIGKPVNLGFTPVRILAMDSRYIFGFSDTHPELLWADLSTEPASVTTVNGVPAGFSIGVASLGGISAAFYYPERRGVWLVSGLPKKPAPVSFVDLSMIGPVTNMAVSDDAGTLVFSVDTHGGSDLYRWKSSEVALRFLKSSGALKGLVLTREGDAIVADRTSDEVFAIRDVNGGGFFQFLAGSRDGVSKPAGVGVLQNGRIHVANGGNRSVLVLDSQGFFLKTLECPCAVSGLDRIGNASAFRLTQDVDGPLYLTGSGRAEDWIFFVPATRSEPQ
jgi:hypothetical protein